MVEYETDGGGGIVEMAKEIKKKSSNPKINSLADEIIMIERGDLEQIAKSISEDAIERIDEIPSIVYFDEYIENPQQMSSSKVEKLHSMIKDEVDGLLDDGYANLHMSGSDDHEWVEAYNTKYIGVSVK